MGAYGEDGNMHLAREWGRSHRRIVFAADMIGREKERALLEAVVKNPNRYVFEHHFAVDLLTTQEFAGMRSIGMVFPSCFYRQQLFSCICIIKVGFMISFGSSSFVLFCCNFPFQDEFIATYVSIVL
ncbi:L-aspartate oxidase 2-a, chloroplastic-like [Solanum dulcamara]|uniref:L-aspartate oxidase 2-a, chloroplastic-like n=1 Tax=Solanum dulcamara TaxID=45834 RepID=UPI002485C3A7|nr:L-aspartate oxidase 2-a, chloroplastic-like [Solanum dulcamara]XP_055802787.1 L-aspartate oxidase 2-a, chloroplastic-like [Solanum dulcamara]